MNIEALKKFVPLLTNAQKEEIVLYLIAHMPVHQVADLLAALTGGLDEKEEGYQT